MMSNWSSAACSTCSIANSLAQLQSVGSQGPEPGSRRGILSPMSTVSQQGSVRQVLSVGTSDRARMIRGGLVLVGYGLLLIALAVALFMKNGWLPIWLAGGATILLSFDRKLGPLPAALLVMLALPVGRGAGLDLPQVLGDVPIGAHDVVPLIGIGMALPAVVRRVRDPRTIAWPALVPLAAFCVTGVIAILIGFLGDQAIRDIIRDTRWWAFYGVGLVALLAGTRRSAVLRALVWGMTLYCTLLLLGLLMPVFNGGLKWYAYTYDPRMRLHYEQAVLLLVAVAFVTSRFVRRPSPRLFALLALLATGIAVTLTRALLAGVMGVGVLTAGWAALQIARQPTGSIRLIASPMFTRALPALLVIGIGIGVGFAAYRGGIEIWIPAGAGFVTGVEPADHPVQPSLNRIFDDTGYSGVDAQLRGRLPAYAEAFVDTAQAPFLGHGMGQLATVSWAAGGYRAYTDGMQPGVDNAYLTIGLKAGAVGIATFAAMMLWPLWLMRKRELRRLRPWFVPAWLALLTLTLIESFAVSGYAPFTLSLLLVVPVLGSGRGRESAG